MSGGNPVIVRSRRVSAKRVRHGAVTPADSVAWQQWLVDAAHPGLMVAGCCTVQESLTVWLQTPFASIQKAERVLPSLLDIQLPFPLESCHYQFVQLWRTPEGATQALAVAARRESLRARLESYQAQRIDPVLLDHEGLALWTQSLEECPLPPEVHRILLFLDADHTTIVLGQGEHYQNAHSIQMSLPALASGDPMSPSAVDGLVGRLQRILRVEMPADARVQWLMCGSGARSTAGVNRLHQLLTDEWPGPVTIHQEPETFLARALSMRALTRAPLRCNLRIHDLAHPALLRHVRRRAMTTAALFLIAGLLLCGWNVTWRLLTAHRVVGVKRAIAGLTAELAPGARIPYGQEVREVEKLVNQRTEQAAPFLNAFAPSLSIRLADLLRAGAEAEVAYETLSLQRTGFSLRGNADDWDQCERLKRRLEGMGYVVTLDRQEALADPQVHFSIKGEAILQPYLRTRQSVSLPGAIHGQRMGYGGSRFARLQRLRRSLCGQVATAPFWSVEIASGEKPVR